MSPERQAPEEALRRIDPSLDATWMERNLARVERARRRMLAARVTACVAVAAALALVGFLGDPRPDTPFATTHTHAVERAPDLARPAAEVVRFADGSSLTPGAAAEVVVEKVSSEQVGVALVRGSVAVEVTPRPTRRFTVRAGPIEVEVLGTAFEVDLEPSGEGAEVTVARGLVQVSWLGGTARLGAGESGRFPPVAREATAPPVDTPARGDRRRSTAREDDTPREDWRVLASRGAYAEAYSLLAEGGTPHDTVEELLLAADTARLSGHPRAALPYLERVSADHASDPRAPLAAFTAGRVLAGAGG